MDYVTDALITESPVHVETYVRGTSGDTRATTRNCFPRPHIEDRPDLGVHDAATAFSIHEDGRKSDGLARRVARHPKVDGNLSDIIGPSRTNEGSRPLLFRAPDVRRGGAYSRTPAPLGSKGIVAKHVVVFVTDIAEPPVLSKIFVRLAPLQALRDLLAPALKSVGVFRFRQ